MEYYEYFFLEAAQMLSVMLLVRMVADVFFLEVAHEKNVRRKRKQKSTQVCEYVM